ncbi:MAG TPA: MOSC N-terminal beta barrel domain-containing protein [Kofleriaceae bacterium]|jgi:uncharacterized protein YcbX
MRLAEIWRYPVKTMAGERLERATVGPLGVAAWSRRARIRGFSACTARSAPMVSHSSMVNRGRARTWERA